MVDVFINPSVEVVIGSRVKMLGTSITRNLVRHYLGRLFATLVSAILHLDIYDSQCGAKLFRSSPLLPSVFRKRFHTRWIFDAEIIVRLILERRRHQMEEFSKTAVEYPIHQWIEVGRSKVRPGDYFHAALDLLWLFIGFRRRAAG
jgi:hypothetical protein